jgi:PAS domain S-box-containing protein
VIPLIPVSAQSAPLIVLAGVTFFVGVYHLLLFFRRPRNREYLTFSVSCLAMGLYDVFCAVLYGAANPGDGALWQRLQCATLALVCISFSWFVLDYFSGEVIFHRGTRITIAAFSLFFLAAAVFGPLNPGDLFWKLSEPLVKVIRLPLGLGAVYNELAPGPLSNAQSVLAFAWYAYVVGLGIRAYRRGARRTAPPFLLSMAIFFLSMLNDTFVSSGVYNFVYTMEYAYMVIVLMVTVSLTGRVVETSIVLEALRASEDRFRGLVETSSDWIWEVDAGGTFSYSSPKVRDLLGYMPEEVIGKSVFDFMTPSDSRQAEERFRVLAASGSPLERMENTNVRKDGGTVVLETNAIPMIDAEGRLVGYRGVNHDITRRKAVEEDLRGRTRQLEALRQLGLELTAELDLDSLLKSIVTRAMELLGVSSGGMYLHNGGRDLIEWRFRIGPLGPPPGSWLRRGEGLSGRVWEKNETLIVNNYQAWEGRSKTNEGLPDMAAIGSPVRWGGEFFGVLCVMNETSHAFTPADAKLLDLFASQAAIAMRNARLFEAAGSRAERLSVVNRIASAVGTALELDQLLETVYRETAGIFAADCFSMALYDEKTGEIELRFKMENGTRAPREKVSVRDGFTSRVIATKEPLLVYDVLNEDTVPSLPMNAGGKTLRSWLGVPLLFGNRLSGVISVQSYRPGAYGGDDRQLLSTIAEQVASVVERARLYRTLRDSEERYRTLFERASDAVILQSMEGVVLDANERACQLLGYTRPELLSLSASDIVSPESPGLLPLHMESAAGTVRTEGEYLCKGGSKVTVEASTTLLKVGGKPVVLIQAHDIMERKRIEEQLRQAQKMEAIGTLAGGIAHDFNNILTGILGYASLLRQELPQGSPLFADVKAIQGSAGRAAELTQQLLTFSRKNPQVEMRPVDLNDVVREVALFLARTIDPSITIDSRLGEGPCTVLGNSGQLHQALLNLCLNARDAMPNGGLLRMETRIDGTGIPPGESGRVSVTVSDTGTGMEAAVRERIFEPFFTTKEKGRGLGLAMVYGIIRGHGGDISVRSEPGKGSFFAISLPACVSEASEPKVYDASIPPGGHETILVVDDEEPVRNVLRRILERGGYSVVLAEDGVRGIELFRERRDDIDLVVLDMAMPRMSGSETFESLLAIDQNVKVLISSGYSEEGRAAELLDRGARGFLRKPYGIEMVLNTVRETLDIKDGT